MATTTAQAPVAPHSLHVSSTTQSASSTTAKSSSTTFPVHRGDVTAKLHFYAGSSDGAAPYNYVEPQPTGTPQLNYGYQTSDVPIYDIRGYESEYTLDKDAFKVIQNVPPSQETSFTDNDSIEANYYPEVTSLLLSNVPGANRIVIFDHTIRRSTPNSPREPVFRTHIDQTGPAAHERVRRHLGPEAETLLQGRHRIINVWRPLNGPVLSNPLAFASSWSVKDEDLVSVEHRYPDRTGYTASVVYNEGQKWNYLSGMTNYERLLLECYDSEAEKPGSGVQGGRVPHSAFIDPRTPEGAPGRESIEVRCLVFGP